MPTGPGVQLWCEELASGVTGKVQHAGGDLEGEGWIVGIMAAGLASEVIRLRDGDASGSVIFVGVVPFFGSPQGDGPWLPRASWIPYTDGIWVQTNTVTNGLWLIVQPGKASPGP